jgi:hypothetical protein
MKSNQWFFPMVTIGLIVLAAGFLSYWKKNQRLGQPGVQVLELDDKGKLGMAFPESVLSYGSEEIEVPDLVINTLPADTTIGMRLYKGGDGFEMQLTGVLMGADRTSIHQPQFCLTGAGFNIKESVLDTIKIESEDPYELPVMILKSEKELLGRMYTGYYIYWFVADGLATAKHGERMWWMAKGLFTTGELQRWAYISCLAVCDPRNEEVTLSRMKSFLAGAIPGFQPRPSMLAPSGGSRETAFSSDAETESQFLTVHEDARL